MVLSFRSVFDGEGEVFSSIALSPATRELSQRESLGVRCSKASPSGGGAR